MPRLGSKKSRKGCQRCRQRRVKCDEQIPCSMCIRRNEHCNLLDSSTINSPEPAADLALPMNRNEWTLDLELMFHCCTNPSYLGARETVVHLWHDYIPRQAFKHSFLMHGLLAFAALHLAHLRPNCASKFLRLCDKHQSIALREFRSVLYSPVNPELGDSLLALAATFSLSCMARSCALSETDIMDMDAVVELFNLTRGIASVIRMSRGQITQGPLAVMLESNTYPEGTQIHLPITAAARFEALKSMLTSHEPDQDSLKHCESALVELEKLYKTILYLSRTTNIETEVLSRWQVLVSTGYIRLIQEHDPPALIILAYYAAAITAIHETWYTQNWAEYTLRGISQVLDSSMQEWLVWPMQQLQDRMSELGVQSLDVAKAQSSSLPIRAPARDGPAMILSPELTASIVQDDHTQ